MVSLRTDISHPTPNASKRDSAQAPTYDVLIVGAGFGGIYLLHKLRDLHGLHCKIFEAGTNLGGIWHWNCYPGARVDTEVPIYEYSLPQVWKDWYWTEKYPGYAELQGYFDHVEKVLDVKRDVEFNARVVGATYNTRTKQWDISTEDGRTAHARYFINAVGFAAKRNFPAWPGLETFKGEMHHSSFWPEAGVNVQDKRVAVIGTGSTGIQIAQDVAWQGAKSVTVFQRTPNLCLPMRQRKLTREEQDLAKKDYPELYRYRLTTFAGFPFDFAKRPTLGDTPEQREAFYQDLWDKGGFHFWLANYDDMLKDSGANDEAYKFWVKKTRERIRDPVKKDILAPLRAPHAWGTKRPSLEQEFYELMDREENEIVDVKRTPVKEVRQGGIVTEDGKYREFDVIALATGFDAVTGGMKNMGLEGEDGVALKDKWSKGTWSYLGMCLNGYPNMFFLYGAQGPTAFSNGPTCVEVQGDWIVEAILKCRAEGITYLNATRDAEDGWRELVTRLSDDTLFPLTDSWYMGMGGDPNKPREQLNFAGGFPRYKDEIRAVLDEGFKGFVTAKG